MGQRSAAPGTCADCENDAYIRLADSNGSTEMVCAHCFADRVPSGAVKKATSADAPKRVEQDARIHR